MGGPLVLGKAESVRRKSRKSDYMKKGGGVPTLRVPDQEVVGGSAGSMTSMNLDKMEGSRGVWQI